ncbi:cytochrome c [Anaerolineales bacterium HSG6]|nr:cytochrome c [Anaerolineales bacterium HSG6]
MINLKSTQNQIILIIIVAFMLSGCNANNGDNGNEETVATVPPPTSTPIQTASVHLPNVERGQETWLEHQCNDCHGPVGLGGIGPMLASTPLEYEEFLNIVRTAISPKPAFSVDLLSDDHVYDIYAWLRTQQPFPEQPSIPSESPTPPKTPSLEDAMGMTVWTHGNCDTCHGVFAQGGPEAPPLAGISYPAEEELAIMRETASEIPEHSVENISDEIFVEHLYKWLQAGCSYTTDCSE